MDQESVRRIDLGPRDHERKLGEAVAPRVSGALLLRLRQGGWESLRRP